MIPSGCFRHGGILMGASEAAEVGRDEPFRYVKDQQDKENTSGEIRVGGQTIANERPAGKVGIFEVAKSCRELHETNCAEQQNR